MAKGAGQVTLRGRFRPGTAVSLIRVPGEHTLRAEGGEEVDRKRVDDSGEVQFKGLEVDGRYFVCGLLDGHPLEVRARARTEDQESEILGQPPILPERARLGLGGSGGFADEQVFPGDPIVGPTSEPDAGDLKGDALHERAAEMNIEGRSQMTADELRDAVARAESNDEEEE